MTCLLTDTHNNPHRNLCVEGARKCGLFVKRAGESPITCMLYFFAAAVFLEDVLDSFVGA